MQTLVIYDISEDKKREKLRHYFLNRGLKRIQYSGLFGNLNANDRLLILDEVQQYISCEADSIYVVPLCDRCLRLCKIVTNTGIAEIKENNVDYVE